MFNTEDLFKTLASKCEVGFRCIPKLLDGTDFFANARVLQYPEDFIISHVRVVPKKWFCIKWDLSELDFFFMLLHASRGHTSLVVEV